MSKLLSLNSISYKIKDQSILEDISFDINQGDYIGLIGPNGAGKTTLLKIILQLFKPTSGSLTYTQKVKVGYVPQKNAHNLKFPVSVKELITTGLQKSNFWTTKTQQQTIIQTLKRVGLQEDILHKNFQKLSGGQQQRVLIARSLINQPNLVLFDEPFNGVDLPTQNKIYTLLDKLNQEGVTIIFVSHDVTTITEKCSRVLCLDVTLHEGCHPVYPEFKTKCSHSHPTQLPIHHHNHL